MKKIFLKENEAIDLSTDIGQDEIFFIDLEKETKPKIFYGNKLIKKTKDTLKNNSRTIIEAEVKN